MNNTQQDINIIAKAPSPEEIRKIMATGDDVDSAITEAISQRDSNYQNTASHLPNVSIDDFGSFKDYFKDFQQLEKLSKTPDSKMNAPLSLDPNETILAKLASGKMGPGATVREGNKDTDGGELTIIGDGNGLFYPLAGQDGAKRSNGPNAVYIPGNGKRINLFSSKKLKVSPSELLARYIDFRDQNIGGIIGLTIDMINKPGGGGKLEDYGDKVDDMKLIASLLGKLQDVKTKEDLNAAGMDIVSFCQTWDPETGNANFSVMSPHFQNRLYITNSERLLGKGASDDEIQAYNRALASMTADEAFLEAYANPPRFINLDELNKTGALNKVANAPAANAPAANAANAAAPANAANAAAAAAAPPANAAPAAKKRGFSLFGRKSKGGKKRSTRKNKNTKKGRKTKKGRNTKKGRKTRKLNNKGKKGKKTSRRA